MAHGGARTGAGRKKKRVTDQAVAARVLDQIDAEKRWLAMLDKASKARTTTEEKNILIYLENRAYGDTTHNVNYSHSKPIEMNVTHSLSERYRIALEKAEQRVSQRVN